jgi:hypothetical protein
LRVIDGRLQAVQGQLLHAALVLDQARIIQGEVAPQFAFQNGLQFTVVDFTVGADGLLEFLRGDLRGFARLQVDGSGGEVDAKGNQPRNDIEQQANGVQYHHHRIDLAVDLAAPVGKEDRAAGGELGQQGGHQNAANETVGNAHGNLLASTKATKDGAGC